MIRQQIARDLRQIQHPSNLNQVYEFVQLIGRTEVKNNVQDILTLSGSLSDENAVELKSMIEREFSTVEGDW
jgi:hypothetical protein